MSALVEDLGRLREVLSDPDNLVEDPANLYEDGNRARACVRGWCLRLGFGPGSEVVDSLDRAAYALGIRGIPSEDALTVALRDGRQLDVVDRAIADA